MKQQAHFRKIGNILIPAGRGVKDELVGESVWFEKQTYLVVKKNKDNTYHLRNMTFHKEVLNAPKHKLRLY